MRKEKNIILYDANGKDKAEVAEYLKTQSYGNLYLLLQYQPLACREAAQEIRELPSDCSCGENAGEMKVGF